jgi:hypothetical protein
MRESSKYLLGGFALLLAMTLFVAYFGAPQRMNRVSPATVGLFLTAFGCVGYGAYLRFVEHS